MIRITHPETVRLAEELARRSGESVDEAVARAIGDRLARLEMARRGPHEDAGRLIGDLEAIADEIAALPELDSRPPDEILGYDEHGAFKPW
jgi:antitoxin VapB